MNQLDTFLSLIQSFDAVFGVVHVAAWHETDEKWGLSVYLFVPFETRNCKGEMPATPTPKLKTVLEDVLGQPIDFTNNHTLGCEVPEVSPDLLRRIEKAVAGNQRDYWEVDPKVIEDMDENPHFYGEERTG